MEKLLTEFYTENYKEYFNKARACLKDHHYAEDAVQEAFERALKYSNTYDKSQPLKTWFNAVFSNTLRSYMDFARSQGVVTELTMKDHPQWPTEMVEKHRGVIQKEIDKYTDCSRKKHMLEVYFLRGFPARATAIMCDCTESTIYNLTHRFRIHLGVKYGL